MIHGESMTKKAITVNLDPEDLEALEDLSRETGNGISTLIREAVKRMLKEAKKS